MASLLPLLRLHNGVSISPDRSPLRLHFSTAKLLARAVPPHSPSLLCPPWPDHTAISKLLLTMASTWPNLMPTSLCSASHQHAPQPSITTLCKYFLLWFKDATIFPWGASARPLAFIASHFNDSYTDIFSLDGSSRSIFKQQPINSPTGTSQATRTSCC